ncbi:uncharacterized protein RCC_08768 [Ramularia collo-cygni]|uniref:Uncharacterized protein n=1 Tax=Ramularia collo-cygni TaxID=112498 RepID=A0A2D3VN00_9PEZI|nr:uncharacterized protein RCC_08768 [Ramularia collo-cygni]CZT23058.1 uncharacterized protein RCC_08768 [Ramularia collo-cygni]
MMSDLLAGLSISNATMRVDGGTLRIRFTPNRAEDLILDRLLVIEHFPTLAPTLRHLGEPHYNPMWDKSILERVEGGGPDQEVRVTTLALNPVEGTFLLESEDYKPSNGSSFYPLFTRSELGPAVWQTVSKEFFNHRSDARVHAIESHILLFRLLHDQEHTFRLEDTHYRPFTESREFSTLLEACAYAQYYGGLHAISSKAVKMMTDCKDFWELLSRNSLAMLRFSVILESKETGMIPRLAIELRNLTLVPLDVKTAGTSIPVRTSYSNVLDYPLLNRSSRELSPYTSRWLAGSIFSNWLIQHESGDLVYTSRSGNPLCRPAGSFASTISQIEHWAAKKFPADLFGQHTAEKILVSMGHNPSSPAIKQVSTELRHIVLAANSLVKKALSPCDVELSDGTAVTWRRARYSKPEAEYLTFLPHNETTFPWSSQDALEEFWEEAVDEVEGLREGEEERRIEWEEKKVKRERRQLRRALGHVFTDEDSSDGTEDEY